MKFQLPFNPEEVLFSEQENLGLKQTPLELLWMEAKRAHLKGVKGS